MKSTTGYCLLFLTVILLLNCNGNVNSKKVPENEPKETINNLYGEEITGDKVEKSIDDTLLFSIICHVFELSNLNFHYIITTNQISYVTAKLKGPVKFIEYKEFYQRRNGNQKLESSIVKTFDDNGCITLVERNDFPMTDYKITYASTEPIRFKSIFVNEYAGLDEPIVVFSYRYDFQYNNMDIPEIRVFRRPRGGEFEEKGKHNFITYENGIMVGSRFYRISASNPSIPIEYYDKGKLVGKRTIDSDGNQYVYDSVHRDTAVFDRSNELLRLRNDQFFSGYQMGVYGKYIYEDTDEYGNWTRMTCQRNSTTKHIITRKILYY